MISRIYISGYKSIKNLELELRPINILLGGNGAGKSNFISLFSLIRNIYNQNLQNYIRVKGGVDSFLHFGKKSTDKIELSIYFGNTARETNCFSISLQEAQDLLLIKSLKTASKTKGDWEFQQFESDKKESDFAHIRYSQFWVNNWIEEFFVYHFHDTGDKSPMKGLADINDNRRLKNDGSNIAAFLYYLKRKHPKHYIRIEKTIQSMAPFFDRFDLEPDRLNEDKILLEWKEKGHPDAYFNAYHLSDGTLRFICLATLLMQPDPPQTIIIDEPELGLHPVAINKLAALVRKASETTQVILSTQSINLIDNFEPEDIIVTDRKDEGSVFKRLDSEALRGWLEEYTLGDLWGQNKLGAQPYSV